ncbi:hypothetical protein AJ87_02995 [Rhizobium yanglingense]|nr:hypothetical protein AJ87_02995 [Rhizobium yanglingense]
MGPLEWEQAQRKAGAASTNVTVGEGDKFYENLDKKNAETFAALSDGGMQARARMGQINRLEGIFANMPQGIEGGFKKIAGDWGIPIGEGTSDIQAASALLEKWSLSSALRVLVLCPMPISRCFGHRFPASSTSQAATSLFSKPCGVFLNTSSRWVSSPMPLLIEKSRQPKGESVSAS